MSRQDTLDRIWSAASTFTVTWSSGIESNKARRVLHYLLCRLYDNGRGQLMNAQLTLAQTTLSGKLGISRQWTHELVSRLQETGWIEYTAPRLANGRRASCTFAIGPMLKRLLVMLSKSKKGNKNVHVKSTWLFSPLTRVKEMFSIQEKEKAPPPEHVIAKIPMLKRWLERGQT